MIYLVFGGPFKAWGVARNRGGGLVQRFEADIDSRVEGSRPILDEVLEYSLDKGIKQPTGMIKNCLTEAMAALDMMSWVRSQESLLVTLFMVLTDGNSGRTTNH